MRNYQVLVFLVALILSVSCVSYGQVFSVRIDSSSTNIPSSFGTGSDSLVLQGIRSQTGMLVDNRSSSAVVVNCSFGPTAAPADNSNHNIYVNAESTIAIDSANLSGTCYVRGETGTVSTGVVVLMAVGS